MPVSTSASPLSVAFPLHARLLLMLVLLADCLGCNVVQFRAGSIRSTFREAQLQVHDEPIGDAQVHYWASEPFEQPPAAGTTDARPVALLLHGFGASAMWQWYEQVGPLSKTHRLLVPDLLWFGESSSDNRDYSLDHQVQVMLALLDQVGAERVDLVGISYGGLVAYELASQRPERVDKLVIVDSPGRVYTRADYDDLCKRFAVDHIGDLLVPKDDAGIEKLLNLAYYDPPWTPAWAREQVREGLYGRFRQEKVELLNALLRDLDELAGRPDPRAPTMLLWGRQDPVFPLVIGKRLQQHLGRGTALNVIDNAKHAPNLEHADHFNELLMGFLAPTRPR